ncbi:MAG: TlpA family protein disulfide reductase [Anaeromyxobacter sp.]|nr:TlpA family protein disulfide reductase [Anaeromyxobacter sp.]MBL0277587.1 TlpA family protein disulfide reductase [Anaeromyxobacter sp.]
MATSPPDRRPRLGRALVLLAGAALVVGLSWSTWLAATRARLRAAAPSPAAGPTLTVPPRPEVPANRLVTAPAPVAAPALDLPTAGGARFSLAAARGQVVVVNFWATWCSPCVRELPSLVQLGRDLAKRHPGKFRIVAVSVDEQPDAVAKFFAEPPWGGLPPELVVALEPGAGAVARGFPCLGRGACRPEDSRLPETYVVDQQGRIVALVVGEIDWSLPGPALYLEALLSG